MSLWKKDPDGDDSLIIGKEDLAAAIKEKQQELGYTMYNFTKIMKTIITSQTPLETADRVQVRPNEEVEINATRAIQLIQEVIAGLEGESATTNTAATLAALASRKLKFDIDTPKSITDDLQETEHPNQHEPTATTKEWIQDLRNELATSLTQITEAPRLAKTMRDGKQCTETLTEDFHSILAKITTVHELREAIRRCQAGKCGGPSGITREHLLYLPDDVLEQFIPLINTIIDGTCTDSYKLGAIVPLLKDERRYRPVTLLETLWKTAMTRISDRLLDVLHKHKLLHPTQYAFLRGGSTHAPLDIMANLTQRSQAKNTETHICFLDATSAYDCVPLWALDIAFRRIGAPEDFIAWIGKTTAGHERIVATCAGISNEKFPLGGLAQGCPFSPSLWVILADMALCHAYQTPESNEPGATTNPSIDGVTLAEAGETPGLDHRISVKAAGYADDLFGAGKSNEEAQKYAQAMVTILGCLNIRVQGSKCIYLRPPIAVANDELCPLNASQLEKLGIESSNGPPTFSNLKHDSLLKRG